MGYGSTFDTAVFVIIMACTGFIAFVGFQWAFVELRALLLKRMALKGISKRDVAENEGRL